MHDAPPMTTYQARCLARTESVPDFVDVTDDVRSAVGDSRIRRGRAIVFAPGDACRIVVNERESGLLADLEKVVTRLKESDGSGISTAIGSSSVVLPVEDGRLALGTWQRVLLVELTEAGSRSLDIEIVGER